MKENVLINIDSTITSYGEDDTVSLTTTGGFYQKDKKFYITYKESEATGFEDTSTMVKVWDNGVSITRFGKHTSNLIIEKGAINLSNYPSPAGNIVLDINGIDIDNNLTEKGGDLTFTYSLNSSGMLISENKVCVNIKEI